MSFEEGQHPRDDHGRFTSGAAAFVAKHTGQLPKLEGYGTAGPRSGLDKWAAKISGRQRDIEVPLVSKTAGGDFASTGNLPMNAETHARIEDFIYAHIRGISTRTAQDAYASARGSFEAQERATKKILALPPYEPGSALADKDNKKRAKAEAKLVAAKAKVDAAYTTWKNNESRIEALSSVNKALSHALSKDGVDLNAMKRSDKEGEWNGRRHNPIKLEGWKGTGATINISVDRKDGTIDIHFSGTSNDPKFPGEKELHLEVKPDRITNSKNAFDPTGIKSALHAESKEETITTQYPSDERGKAYPNEVQLESKGHGVESFFYLPDALREHVQKFRTS